MIEVYYIEDDEDIAMIDIDINVDIKGGNSLHAVGGIMGQQYYASVFRNCYNIGDS